MGARENFALTEPPLMFQIENIVVLVVAHTMEDSADGAELIRIVTARRADRTERRRYDQERLRASRA